MAWASGVQDDEAVQSLSAIVGIITSLYYSRWPWGLLSPIVGLRPFGSWVIPDLPEGGPYSSFNWYAESAFDEEAGAIDADRFLDLVEHEPWQKESKHYDFSLVHVPLRYAGRADDTGLAWRRGLAAVVSVDWARAFSGVANQQMALRRLAYHGMGLAFGLDPHLGEETVCAMRPFDGRADLLAKAQEERQSGVIYCDCHERALLGILLSGREPLN